MKTDAPTASRNARRDDVRLPWCPTTRTWAASSLAQHFTNTPSIELSDGGTAGDWWPPASASPISRTAPVSEVDAHVLPYDPIERERWVAAQHQWRRSNRTDYSVWGKYAALVRDGRLLLPQENAPQQRFVEFRAALSLQTGFDCWGQVLLFAERRRVVHGKGNAVRNTERVKSFPREWPWPTEIQHTLAFQPRNPDLVAYDHERAEWRFCEVKETDPVSSGQLGALGVLHLLTGAPVAVVRLVAHGRHREPRSYHADAKFNPDTRVDWIRPDSFRYGTPSPRSPR